MRPYPQPVLARLAASGGLAPVSLVEILTVGGAQYFWSDASVLAPSMLTTGNALKGFVPWITKPGSFSSFKSTQTATGSFSVQNLSGDSVRRDAATAFSTQEFLGALVYYREWLTDCEYSIYNFCGSVDDAQIEVDGDTMTLSLESFACWSKIPAPYKQTGVSCPLTFGSIECGSTAQTPCDNNYGTCSSVERIQAIILEWTGATLDYSQYVQPQEIRIVNGRVAN